MKYRTKIISTIKSRSDVISVVNEISVAMKHRTKIISNNKSRSDVISVVNEISVEKNFKL